jgi:hypothetical protein
MFRYSSLYVVKPGDNLGSASYWNPRFQDLDLRLNEVESFTSNIDDAAQQVIDAGIYRIDNTFQPALNALIAEIGTLSGSVAELQDTVIADQNNITVQLNALLSTAEGLVAELESLATIDGGAF